MPSLPDYVFGTQGLFLIANGAYTLLYPHQAATAPSPLAGTPVAVVHAMSMTSFSLGFFFLQVAYQGNRDLMKTAVPLRFFAAFVFYFHGGLWRNVGWYEAAWGTISTVSLLWK